MKRKFIFLTILFALVLNLLACQNNGDEYKDIENREEIEEIEENIQA